MADTVSYLCKDCEHDRLIRWPMTEQEATAKKAQAQGCHICVATTKVEITDINPMSVGKTIGCVCVCVCCCRILSFVANQSALQNMVNPSFAVEHLPHTVPWRNEK